MYEHRDSVGGTWNYTPLSPIPRKPVLLNGDVEEPSDQIALDIVTNRIRELNTPMYDGLESNLPHMLMQFSDKPFWEKTQLFPSRGTVMKYLDDYANDIKPMINFEHEVKYVKPTTVGSNFKWEILVKSSSGHRVEKFDAVVVANGHCASPLLPDIEGLETWCRKFPDSLHHSVSYKNPESFKNKVSKTLTSFSQFIPQHQYLGHLDINQQSSVSSLSEVAPQGRISSGRSRRSANILFSSLESRSHPTTPTSPTYATTQPSHP